MREWHRKAMRDRSGRLPARRLVMRSRLVPNEPPVVTGRFKGMLARIASWFNAAIKALFYVATTLAAIVFSYLQWDTSRSQAKMETENRKPRLQIIQSSEYPTQEDAAHFPTLALTRNFDAARFKKIELTEYVGLRGKNTVCYARISDFYQLNIETGVITPKPVLEAQLRKLAKAITHNPDDFDHSMFEANITWTNADGTEQKKTIQLAVGQRFPSDFDDFPEDLKKKADEFWGSSAWLSFGYGGKPKLLPAYITTPNEFTKMCDGYRAELLARKIIEN